MSDDNYASAVVPAGLWLKTHIRREGKHLLVTIYTCAAGSPEVANVSIDLEPIIRRVIALHKKLHERAVRQGKVEVSGFPGSLIRKVKNSVKDVAKSKVLRVVTNTVKDVVKSKITGAAIGGLAVVFPPVGIPAAAAYATANQVVNAIDTGKTALNAVTSKNPLKAVEVAALGAVQGPLAKAIANVPLEDLAKTDLKKLVPAQYQQAAELLSQNAQAKAAVLAGLKAKSEVVAMAKKAKNGDKEAQAGVKVLNVALQTKRSIQKKPAVKSTPKGVQALVIDRRGAIIPGRYEDRTPTKGNKGSAIMLRGRKVYKGTFNKVAGCVVGFDCEE